MIGTKLDMGRDESCQIKEDKRKLVKTKFITFQLSRIVFQTITPQTLFFFEFVV